MSEQQRRQCLVRFYTKAVKDAAASREAGRDIYTDKPWVKINWPGNQKSELHAPAFTNGQKDYRRQFPAEWEAYKRGEEDAVVGTPLKEAPFVSRSQAAELAYRKVVTVEQLAGMLDSHIAEMGPGTRDLVEKAKVFLKTASDNAVAEKAMAENAELRAQLSALQEQVAGLVRKDTDADDELASPANPFLGWRNDDLKALLRDHGLKGVENLRKDQLATKAFELNAAAEQAAEQAA